jgi:hypothetical protein
MFHIGDLVLDGMVRNMAKVELIRCSELASIHCRCVFNVMITVSNLLNYREDSLPYSFVSKTLANVAWMVISTN